MEPMLEVAVTMLIGGSERGSWQLRPRLNNNRCFDGIPAYIAGSAGLGIVFRMTDKHRNARLTAISM